MVIESPSSKERKYLILKRLIDGEHLSYHHLAEDYLVSRSSIANDITWIKNLLAEDNVPLQFDNSGTFIQEEEIKIQDIVKRIIFKLSNSKYKALFLNKELYEEVNEAITKAKQKYSFEISDIYLKNIILTTTILIQRSNKGYFIKGLSENEISLLKDMKNYPLANELIQSVQIEGIYFFKKVELEYLSYITLISEIQVEQSNDNYSDQFKIQLTSFIDSVADSLNTPYIKQDSKLIKDLRLHVYQMLMRLNTHTTVVNPLLREIKSRYARTYGIVWYFLNEFGHNHKLQISDDEVAFITIHFQAALERKRSTKQILFVCPHGIGTSSLAVVQLKRVLPTNSQIEITSLVGIKDRNLNNIDFVISTIPLPKLAVPVVKISPLITSNDLKAVMDCFIDSNSNPSSNTFEDASADINKDLLKKNILCLHPKDKEEVLKKLIDLNSNLSDQGKEDYLQSVREREDLQSTYLGNGFAIPHGDPALIPRSCISIAILDKPIKWGNNKVNIVCLLMINNTDKKLLEPFMNLIMEGINNKDQFIKKVMELN